METANRIWEFITRVENWFQSGEYDRPRRAGYMTLWKSENGTADLITYRDEQPAVVERLQQKICELGGV